jgi:hypothetical protein
MISGAYASATLDLSACGPGDIANINGVLSCQQASTTTAPPILLEEAVSFVPINGSSITVSVPNGSFVSSCSNCSIANNTLSCSCYNMAGAAKSTSLNLNACGMGDISNQNGTLTCVSK